MKSILKFAVILLSSVAEVQSFGACVTELGTIVKTARGRVLAADGKPFRGANIEVVSESWDALFSTETNAQGEFVLSIAPGKYRVRVGAEKHLPMSYVVDLRSGSGTGVQDIYLQGYDACHDIGLADDKQNLCLSEELTNNLVLTKVTSISGQVKDQTTAPFKNTEVILKSRSNSILQPGYLETKTDDEGRFKFDEAEPGEYRLLASPSRAFAQPEHLDCGGQINCNLQIALKANASDSTYASCPVQ